MTDATRLPLMAGNWKMNLNHFEAIALVQKLAFALKPDDYEACEVAVLPPFTDIRSVQTLVDGDKLNIRYGAQDLSAHDSGAYTGEISGAMLAKLGCTYVTVGTQSAVSTTTRATNGQSEGACGLPQWAHPIVCIGEALEIRKGAARLASRSASSMARSPD